MPELPEVETIRRDLAPAVIGRRIVAVRATGPRTFRRGGATAFAHRVAGRGVESLDRRGKYLLAGLDSGDRVVVHLGMSGQLLLARTEPAPVHTHLVLALDGGGGDRDRVELRFVDPRTFGEVFVTGASVPELSRVGVDAFEEIESPAHLGRLLRARRAMLKPLLMDQRTVAGLGNIYTDEILFAARLGHDRRSDTLTDAEVRRLHREMRRILDEAVTHRGSSLADRQYRDASGAVGAFQALHQVYGREGRPCPRCGRAIARVVAAGRSTFHCTRCQK